MFAPVLQRIYKNKSLLLERTLPSKGNLFVQKNDVLEPFQKLGDCMYSNEVNYFEEDFNPIKFLREKVYFKSDSLLGSYKGKNIYAPFNGYLNYDEQSKGYFFQEIPSKFNLLSGVWGEVKEVVPEVSVLIQARVTDISLIACTDKTAFGEFVVFPNPTEILEKYYLESFIKSTEDKIVYVGHYADLDLIKKAIDLKVSALIAGSVDPEGFIFAKKHNLGLGLVTGFGRLETPAYLYEVFNSVAYRHVFFHGDKGLLRIPMAGQTDIPVTAQTKTTKSRLTVSQAVKKVTKDQRVQVLQKPHFGKVGIIDRVLDSSIFVKFDNELGPVEISLPNFFIVE